jgi:FtsP/CotA-like multicopper oxidase with cupredoxin domain
VERAGGETRRPDMAAQPTQQGRGALIVRLETFHLIAAPVVREFAPGFKVNCWGYNGSTPGPTIEAVEGDRVRIYVENRLPEPTTVHWHGVLLPNAMDGVAGLNQPRIEVGETFRYEFAVRQHGTHMHHPHFDEMVQQSMEMMGFLIFHPRVPKRRIDRDFAIFVNEWAIKPGTSVPDPSVMLDFNVFTFNSRVFPVPQAHARRGRGDGEAEPTLTGGVRRRAGRGGVPVRSRGDDACGTGTPSLTSVYDPKEV